MQSMTNLDLVRRWQKTHATNGTAYATRGITTAKPVALATPSGGGLTLPTGDGVINIAAEGGGVPSTLQFVFFGAGSATQTFTARIWGARLFGTVPTLVFQEICEATVTLGAITGDSTADLGAADRLGKSIAVNQGVGTVYAPTADTAPAVLEVPTAGCGLFTVDYAAVSATSGNGLWTAY